MRVLPFSSPSPDQTSQPAAQAPVPQTDADRRELTISPLSLILMAETCLPAAVIADCLDRDRSSRER